MFEPAYFPRRVYVEEKSLDYHLTRKILNNLRQIPYEVVSPRQARALAEEIKHSRDPIGEGKQYLYLTAQKGKFVKSCPCTPHYIGCNYYIINLILNCPLDCSYCILQHYLSSTWIIVPVNLEDLWQELDVFLEKKRQKFFRIGTGELSDSLALDHVTENSIDLISYFRKKPNAYFELKTKTVNIQNILKIKPAENIVISWSLNTSRLAQEEEDGAPSVAERLKAAEAVAERGFSVGFHFDPLIRSAGWEEDYEEVIRKLLKAVSPRQISWISLGSLRFPAPLKKTIKTRFPGTKIIYDEFVQGKDGKLRYFRPLRLELYRFIVDRLKRLGGRDIPLYFCMESAEVWEEILGWRPRGKRHVEHLLSPRI